MMTKARIVVAPGDGIGPEITRSVLQVLEAAEVPIEYETIEVGESVYLKGQTSGVPDEAWELFRATNCLLKGPITTPQGKGFKSVNVTIRKTLNLFANIRPTKAYSPFVASSHPGMNLTIIRENEEDLYAGIEHRQTQEVTQVLKLITRPGCENIVRYAFEYAKAYGRRKVTCMTKDNIMKLTDGLFHQVFDEIALEYPEIESDHQIIDIGAARLAAQPEIFDVIVTLNLYGDILSDIASQIAGSVGLAGSANIGNNMAMFEAVHGSAPDIAGRDVANPSGLLTAATQMLVHLGLGSYGETIKNAWLRTLEDGIHTADIYREGLSKQEVGTKAFTEAIIQRLGQTPVQLEPVAYMDRPIKVTRREASTQDQVLTGTDVFLAWDENERDPDALGEQLGALAGDDFNLVVITNRGVKVYPEGMSETFCTDHWRCRFMAKQSSCDYSAVLSLMGRINEAGLQIIKTENLYDFDGAAGYSLAQGQ
ncbi:MAG TPA: NADP-dependent isocitrate dehydrogenase [Planctomycetaceae bacterium]|nr:NADP-dependent isocitrate dehydrogenase [Planctomycetaceae bacterium]